MLVAIAATKNDLSGEVSDQGARAPYYLLIEGSDLKEVISNPFAKGGGGAGFAVAKLLEQNKVGKLLAIKIGDNMIKALEERNIVFEKFESNIEEYLNKQKNK